MSKTGNDLTQGNVVRQLITFALPFMISNIVQSLYNVADMLIVGRFGGAVGISAVNIGGQVTFIITNIVIGLSVGGTVVIGQYMGSRDRKSAVESISTMMISLLAAAVVITVAMMILATPILNLIQTPPEAFAQAREYLQITVLGCCPLYRFDRSGNDFFLGVVFEGHHRRRIGTHSQRNRLVLCNHDTVNVVFGCSFASLQKLDQTSCGNNVCGHQLVRHYVETKSFQESKLLTRRHSRL